MATPDDAGVARQRDAERTRAEILDVATAEFARNGYSAASTTSRRARARQSG